MQILAKIQVQICFFFILSNLPIKDEKFSNMLGNSVLKKQ